MRSGRLNKRVQVLRRDPTLVSATGALIGQWLPLATVGNAGTIWAGFEPVIGNESWAGAVFASEVTGKVRTRYWPQILPTDRIRYQGKDYEILAVIDPDMSHNDLEMPVRWILNEGDGASG